MCEVYEHEYACGHVLKDPIRTRCAAFKGRGICRDVRLCAVALKDRCLECMREARRREGGEEELKGKGWEPCFSID